MVSVFGSLLGSDVALAAPASATAKKIDALNDKALAAHKAGDSDAAKDVLLEAVVLAKSRGLDTHASVARSYLALGVVHVEGLKDETKGARYFAAALRIDPAIQLPGTPAPAVAQVFESARAQAEKDRAQAAQIDAEANAEAAALASGKETAAAKTETAAAASNNANNKTAPKAAPTAAQAAASKAEQERDSILIGVAQSRAQEADERAKQAGQREQDARKEIERLRSEIARVEAGTKQEREAKDKVSADKDRIYNEKVALEKQLADANAREKATAQRLAEAEAREKKEREAKDKLAQELQGLRTKIDQETKAAQERERLAKEAETKLKQEQAKLAAGPEMPASLSERVHCSAPDETPPGVDLYVHCAVKSDVKADELTLHVRPSGSARFHGFAMNRSAKGWHVAMVPAVLLKGSMLQYYVEAAGSNGRVVATNGKPAFPNVVMVNRLPTAGGTATASTASDDPPPAKLVKARAQGRGTTR
ncbi:MAG TPA: hypothetical protein VGF45_17670 [Polyangia bacterium]